jgi:hypothetical protein
MTNENSPPEICHITLLQKNTTSAITIAMVAEECNSLNGEMFEKVDPAGGADDKGGITRQEYAGGNSVEREADIISAILRGKFSKFRVLLYKAARLINNSPKLYQIGNWVDVENVGLTTAEVFKLTRENGEAFYMLNIFARKVRTKKNESITHVMVTSSGMRILKIVCKDIFEETK